MARSRGFGPIPVTDYKQAAPWLIAYAPATEVAAFMEGGHPTPVMQLMCDFFWVSPEKLRHDLNKCWKQRGVY